VEFNCSQPRVKKRPGTGLASQIFMLSGIGVAEGGAGLVASANHGPIRASTRHRKARLSAASTTAGATGNDMRRQQPQKSPKHHDIIPTV
jgi:hypothetical protein